MHDPASPVVGGKETTENQRLQPTDAFDKEASSSAFLFRGRLDGYYGCPTSRRGSEVDVRNSIIILVTLGLVVAGLFSIVWTGGQRRIRMDDARLSAVALYGAAHARIARTGRLPKDGVLSDDEDLANLDEPLRVAFKRQRSAVASSTRSRLLRA